MAGSASVLISATRRCRAGFADVRLYRERMRVEDVDGLRRHIYRTFPEGVSVPRGATEDEAILAVQQQFTDAGYDMPADSARDIVHRAWGAVG
jgi:hypothetical protein